MHAEGVTADSSRTLRHFSILKKKGELEFYKERFFSWRRINDRDDPNQHIAAQRDSWRTFVRLENENKMERLLRRGNARAERRTPANDRANPSSGRRSVAPWRRYKQFS
ncbi:hypothetical protein FI667_g5681, partial [Globisporangium splendens]